MLLNCFCVDVRPASALFLIQVFHALNDCLFAKLKANSATSCTPKLIIPNDSRVSSRNNFREIRKILCPFLKPRRIKFSFPANITQKMDVCSDFIWLSKNFKYFILFRWLLLIRILLSMSFRFLLMIKLSGSWRIWLFPLFYHGFI